MKLAALKYSNKKGYGIGRIEADGSVRDLTDLTGKESLTSFDINQCFDLDGEIWRKLGDPSAGRTVDRQQIPLAAPIPRPGKVICIGLNYRNHAIEAKMAIPTSPIIFSKFSSCVIGPDEPILLPSLSAQVDYEAELAVVIGRRAKAIKKADARSVILGYCNFNDVSARDLQFADGQWQRGKSCDTFAPMGEYIVTADEVPEPEDLRIRFRLNGETLQDSSTSELIFGVSELIAFLSNHITLEPGDIIATGTPPGVGFARDPQIFLEDGDVCEVEIEGLGILRNPVIASNVNV